MNTSKNLIHPSEQQDDANTKNSLLIKRAVSKKLTFGDKKPEQTSPFKSLTKAQERQIFFERETEKLDYQQDFLRSPKKSNTLIGFFKNEAKNPLMLHAKNKSMTKQESSQISVNNTLFTPKSGDFINTSKEINSTSYRKIVKPRKTMYQTQNKFLKKIVKINKPKFEVKLDFLNAKDLHLNYKNFLFAQGILAFIKSQCKSSENNMNVYKFVEISKDTYTYILQLFPLVKTAINSIRNRSDFDKAFHEIETKCQQSRNMALTLKSLLLHAKIIFMFQDVYKAIIIYKNCKKLCISFQLVDYLISCYKGLGRCFQYLKQYSLALTYFSKMLQCSWKLNDKDHEILAYDLIGMQFYYMGDLEKSKYYHQRMVDGELEPESSNVRKLAVINFLHKKTKSSIRDLNKLHENPLNQFTENLLDSSDEAFQLPNPNNTKRNASEPDLKKFLFPGKNRSINQKKKVFIPGKNLMAIMEKKKRKERMIGSIRTTDEFKRLFSKNISEGRLINKGGNGYVGEKQEKVMLSHLSPNRELMNYQLFKPTGVRNINFYNINDYLYENEEFAVSLKIKEKLKKYAEKLFLTMNKLKAIFSKSNT